MEWLEWLATGSNLSFLLSLKVPQRRQLLADRGLSTDERHLEPDNGQVNKEFLANLLLEENAGISDDTLIPIIQELLSPESIFNVSGGKSNNVMTANSSSSSILGNIARREERREVQKFKEFYKDIPIASGPESYADYSKDGAYIQIQKDSDGESETIITYDGRNDKIYTVSVLGNTTPGSRYVLGYVDISKGPTTWLDSLDVSKGSITISAEKPRYTERSNGDKVFAGYSHYNYSGEIKDLVLPETTKQNIATREKIFLKETAQKQIKTWKGELNDPSNLKDTLKYDQTVYHNLKTNRSLIAFVASEKICKGYYSYLNQAYQSLERAGDLANILADFHEKNKNPELIIGLDILALKTDALAIKACKKTIANEYREVNVILNFYSTMASNQFIRDCRNAKPFAHYFKLFSRGGKYHDDVPTVNVAKAKKKWKKGNHDFAENALKVRLSLAAKREELFYQSEEEALANASSAYINSLNSGDTQKEALANASSIYVSSLIHEDIKFVRVGRGRAEKYWHHEMSELMKQDPMLAGVISDYLAIKESQWILSVGADILKRQVKTTKKFWHDEHHIFGALRAEILLLRLTTENQLAQRYQAWYAAHPEKQYHPVKRWFAGAWKDIWDTLTLPYRATKAEIKAWKSGASFWGGIAAGWHTEGKILHQDVKGLNKTIGGIEDLVAPIFTWIPGVKKVVKVANLVGRAVESIPFHIAKDLTSLEKQLWKVITFKATWAGIYKGIGRDTKSIRHMIHRVTWLLNNIIHGNFKEIYVVIRNDVVEIDQVAKIYFHEKEIKSAIKIEQHKLKIRKKLHHETHGLVRSPIEILGRNYYNTHPKSNKYFAQVEKNIKIAKGAVSKMAAESMSWFDALTPKMKLYYYRELREGNLTKRDLSKKTRDVIAKKYPEMDVRGQLKPLLSGLKVKLAADLDKIKADFDSRLKTLLLDGKVTAWAVKLDKKTIDQFKFASRHETAVFNAMVDYEELKKLNEANKVRNKIKQENTDISSEWKRWGHRDAKIALTGYEVSLRPQFTVNYATSPPTVTCSLLTAKTSKSITSNLQQKHVGYRLFRDLMWAYVIKSNSSCFKRLLSADQSLVDSNPLFKVMQEIGVNRVEAKFNSASKLIRQEKVLLEVLSMPISFFDKANYQTFEAQQFDNLKIIELQAALEYDFAPQGKNKTEPSRIQDMIDSMKKNNKILYSDLSKDQAAEGSGQILTIGEILASVMPSSSGNVPSNNSNRSFNRAANGGNAKPTPPTPPKTNTANLLLLYRNYHLIKHILTPKDKEIVVEKIDDKENEKLIDSYHDFKRKEMRLDETVDEIESKLEEVLEDDIKEDVSKSFDELEIDQEIQDGVSDFDNVIIETEEDIASELITDETVLNDDISTIAADAAEDALV
jgi:hypothetical protein